MLKNINFTSRKLYVSIIEKEMPVPWHTLLRLPNCICYSSPRNIFIQPFCRVHKMYDFVV